MAFSGNPAAAGDHQDFRGTHTDYLRYKDTAMKYTRYRHHIDRCRCCADGEAEQWPLYRRDWQRGESNTHCAPTPQDQRNFNKANRRSNCGWWKPTQRARIASEALGEISLAQSMSTSYLIRTSTYTPPARVATAAPRGSPLEAGGGDRAMPLRALPLDAFIKQPTVRATEKMVHKEYEVVDDNGATVSGRKARELLRKPALSTPAVDDGFELI